MPAPVDNNPACGTCGTTGGQSDDARKVPAYVGNGRGCYKQETTYKYVGEGAGEFDLMVANNPNRRPDCLAYCCLITTCLSLAILLPVVLFWALRQFTAASHIEGHNSQEVSMRVKHGSSDVRKFDCDAGYDHWESKWSIEHKAWCCEHHKRGCFDCTLGRPDWEKWSAEKKTFCCHEPGACPTTQPPTTTMHFDCNKGFENWVHEWSIPKRVYCCLNARRACPTAPPVPRPPPPPPMRAMPPPAPAAPVQPQPAPPAAGGKPPPFHCGLGYVNWQAGWSAGKKAYCCEHEKKGCVAVPTPPPFDCNENYKPDYHYLLQQWPLPKRQWCCVHARRGCAPPQPNPAPAAPAVATTSKPFDCTAGYSNWKVGWSVAKISWCCTNEHKACSGKASHGSIDCSQGYSSWRASWGPVKKTWCCQHEGKGCN